MKVARRYIISGAVQGVGYRFFTQRAAARHQVLGYVRNLKDGRVEDFKHDLLTGPTYSKVEEIEETVVDPTNLYSSFRIEK
jgi:acylphosphatase